MVKSTGLRLTISCQGQSTFQSFEGRSQGGSGLREPETDLGFLLVLDLLCDFVQVDQPLWASVPTAKSW